MWLMWLLKHDEQLLEYTGPVIILNIQQNARLILIVQFKGRLMLNVSFKGLVTQFPNSKSHNG